MIEISEGLAICLLVVVVFATMIAWIVAYWRGLMIGYDTHKTTIQRIQDQKAQAVKDRAKAQVDAWIEEQMKKDGVL